MTQPLAISVAGLTKNYGTFEAVRGIDFEVATGEVFGLLGPNGAGKTTTVEILEGIRQRTAGDVRVLDYDPDKQKNQLKDRIGVCLQATNLPDKIKVIEALQLFGALYSRMLEPDDLLKRLQLEDKREAFYSTLSGGQKQRLAIALGLINDPSLLFLDEPTTGLDPQVRLEIHALLKELRNEKRTILLTTHYIRRSRAPLRPRGHRRFRQNHRHRHAPRAAGPQRQPLHHRDPVRANAHRPRDLPNGPKQPRPT